MPGLEEGISYRMEIADNISKASGDVIESQKGLQTQVAATKDEVMRQDISFIKSVSSLSAFRRGVTGIVSGLDELGVISRKTHPEIYKIVGGVNLFVGAAQGIKGVIGIVNMLRASEIGLAAVEAYRAVLQNPLRMAAVIGGAAVAGGVAGFLIGVNTGGGGGGGGGNTGTTVNQQVNFYAGGPDYSTRSTARDSLEGVG